MSSPRVHTLGEDLPPVVPIDPAGHADHPALRDDADDQKGPVDFFDQMSADFQDIASSTAALRIYWPGWNKTLVAVFHPPSSEAIDRLVVAVKQQEGGKTEKNRALILGTLAEACVSLHYKGRLVDEGAGFGPNMQRVLRAPQGVSTGRLAWLALKEDDTLLGPFMSKVQAWMEDPSPEDHVSDPNDPFGFDSAPADGPAS